jgi:hypothetical protein
VQFQNPKHQTYTNHNSKTPTLQIKSAKIPKVRNSKLQNVKIPQIQNSKIPTLQNAQTPQSPNSKRPNSKNQTIQNSNTLNCPNFRTSKLHNSSGSKGIKANYWLESDGGGIWLQSRDKMAAIQLDKNGPLQIKLVYHYQVQ